MPKLLKNSTWAAVHALNTHRCLLRHSVTHGQISCLLQIQFKFYSDNSCISAGMLGNCANSPDSQSLRVLLSVHLGANANTALATEGAAPPSQLAG